MTDEETKALDALRIAIEGLRVSSESAERRTQDRLRIIEKAHTTLATQVAVHHSDIARVKGHASDALKLGSQVDLSREATEAAMMIAVDKLSASVVEQAKGLAEVKASVEKVAVETVDQTKELGQQTVTLAEQTTTLERFRKTPLFTSGAAFAALVLAELIKYALAHP